MVLNILDLNDSNVVQFNKLSKNGKSIIIFHASWCGHCKALNAIWGDLTSRLKSSNLEGFIGRAEEKVMSIVDVDSSIRGYPTIRVYNNGVVEKDYEGSRDVESLYSFINETLLPINKVKNKKINKRKSVKRKIKRRRSKTKSKKKKETKSIRKRKKQKKSKRRGNKRN